MTSRLFPLVLLILSLCIATSVRAESIFLEAESFTPSSDGWKVNENPQTRGASAVTALNGATGDPKGTAETTFRVSGVRLSNLGAVWYPQPISRGISDDHESRGRDDC